MKRYMHLIFVCSVALLLSACDITFSGNVKIDLLPPGVTIDNAAYSTNFSAKVNGVEQFVICNDRTTELSYSFDFTGNLNSWESFLEGKNTGEKAGEKRFSTTGPFVVRPGHVEVTYEILSSGAPRLTAPELGTEAIVVVPKQPIGYSKLFINVDDFARNFPLSSSFIPILETCQNP